VDSPSSAVDFRVIDNHKPHALHITCVGERRKHELVGCRIENAEFIEWVGFSHFGWVKFIARIRPPLCELALGDTELLLSFLHRHAVIEQCVGDPASCTTHGDTRDFGLRIRVTHRHFVIWFWCKSL